MLSVAIAYFLHMTGLDLAWCFLIVFVLYVLIAGAARLHRHQEGQAGQARRSGPSTRPRRPRTSSSVAERDPRRSPDAVEIPGPWQHRHVAANGARFHVAEAGPADGPLVLLLHGFPEFWWTWRDAAAGARRGRLPRRRDGPARLRRLRQDPRRLRPADPRAGRRPAWSRRSAAAARSLVGHGWGGYVAWATAVLHAREVSALCAVSAPHPAAMLRAPAARRRRRCGTCSRCRCRGAPSAGWPTRRRRLPRATTCGPGALPAPRSRTSTPSRRTSGRSRCGRPRTARWSTTAGCSAPGCAPTGAAFGRLMRPPVGQPVLPRHRRRRPRAARAPACDRSRAPRRRRAHRARAARASATSRTRRTRRRSRALLLRLARRASSPCDARDRLRRSRRCRRRAVAGQPARRRRRRPGRRSARSRCRRR